MEKLILDPATVTGCFKDEFGTTGITSLMVLKSAAGYYIGRVCDDGPYSRDSGYYPTRKEATLALCNNTYLR